MENNKDNIISTYGYYLDILDIILSDISNATLDDIQDVIDELHVELNKIKEKEDEMPTDKDNGSKY